MKLKELTEAVFVQNIKKAPPRFHKDIMRMATRNRQMYIDDGLIEPSNDDVIIRFGENRLPSDKNTIHIGNKYLDKERQYSALKGVVNTIKTFTNVVDLKTKEFIAKKKKGEKQQGQLKNEIPKNPEDYIYQGYVQILAEFRVIVYFMNGDYHVSGIYKKSGSNVSFQSINTTSGVGKELTKIAIKATTRLGYGLGGCDIAIVSAENLENLVLSESFVGKLSSKGMKKLGSMIKMDDLLNEHYPVILEVNAMPSMGNPAILQDLVQSIMQNRQ